MQTKTPDDIYNTFKTQAREAKLTKAREEEAQRRELEEAERRAQADDVPPPFVAYYHKGAIILPPVSVAITTNCENNGVTHVLLNIVLWTCLALPGIIHAFWVLLKWDERLRNKSPEVIYVQQAPTNTHPIAPPQKPHISPGHQDVQQHPPNVEAPSSSYENTLQYPPNVKVSSSGYKSTLKHPPNVGNSSSAGYKSSRRHDGLPNYYQSQREAII